jgi:hypothetical protein
MLQLALVSGQVMAEPVHGLHSPLKQNSSSKHIKSVPGLPPALLHCVVADASHTDRPSPAGVGRQTLHLAEPHAASTLPAHVPTLPGSAHELHSPVHGDEQHTPIAALGVSFQHVVPLGHVDMSAHGWPVITVPAQSPAPPPKPGLHWHTSREMQTPCPLQPLLPGHSAVQSGRLKPELQVHVFAPVHTPPPLAELQLGARHENASHNVPV